MDLPITMLMTVLRLSDTVKAQLDALLTPNGIGLTDVRLLCLISLMKRSSQKLLAQKMGLSQVVISTRLEKLERMGLVTREQTQGRQVAVDLSDDGRQLLKRTLEVIGSSTPARAFGRLEPGIQADLAHTLGQWMQHMQAGSDSIAACGAPDPLHLPDDPRAAVKRRLDEVRLALDRNLADQNYQFSEAIQRLTDELDTLIEAYMALRAGKKQPGS